MVTSSADLLSEMMQYSSPDGAQIDAYLSQPASPGNYPGVIVTMEGMGLEDHMKDLCRRFAEQGYFAIAPDHFTREGRPALDKVLENLFAVPDSQAMGDLEGAALYLKGHQHASGRVGIIGFCSGARPVAAIDMVANLSCPLLALFGEEDANPSPAHAARLREELDKHNKTYEFQTYADAGHAFFADYRPSYRAGPAQDMWHRLLLFYEEYLKS